jgi:hypothetical protein
MQSSCSRTFLSPTLFHFVFLSFEMLLLGVVISKISIEEFGVLLKTKCASPKKTKPETHETHWKPTKPPIGSYSSRLISSQTIKILVKIQTNKSKIKL